MPSLSKYLSSIDHDLLYRIAYHWEIDVESGDLKKIESSLVTAMTSRQKVVDMIDILPPDAKPAWNALLAKSNRIPWSEFSHQFGLIRELGPAARERENPDQHPVNTTEYLYYRGLIARAFMDASPEPREFAFIPDEIASLFQFTTSPSSVSGVRPVPPSEIKRHQSGNTRLLDHLTDWLAQLRMDQKLEPGYFEKAQVSQQFVAATAASMKLVSAGQELSPEKIGSFLQADRLTTLRELFQQWKSSEETNDLLMMPGLVFEGTWRNDPVYSRQVILQQVVNFDLQTWFSLSSFISRIKTESPDFLRPAGDFDSWSIRKKGTKEYLSGREHWEAVEGAYIQYLFAGPLHWLGMVDLAYDSNEPAPIAFRISPIAGYLLKPDYPAPVMAPETAAKLLTDLTIVMPVNSSRLLRYQVGRFTRIISNSVSETRFQISADSLTTAEKHGLKVDQLLQLLEKQVKLPLPASYKKLAQRWDQRRIEVKMEKATLLRVEDPEVIKILMDNPRTARLIRETLTDNIVLLEPAGMELVKKVLLEAGILSQIELDV
jgi:hypothetical protein